MLWLMAMLPPSWQKFLVEYFRVPLSVQYYLCFVDDLSNDILSSQYKFADDTKMVKQILSIIDCPVLQYDLENLFLIWKVDV